MRGNTKTTDWQLAWPLFEIAADLDLAARSAFLNAVGDRDAALRRRVESMLAIDAETATFLDRPAFSGVKLADPTRDDASGRAGADASDPIADPARPRADDDTAPVTVGAYRIVRKIGQGGMSTVYLATREDADFVREVVIKVVRQDLDDPILAARLRVERNILAGLRHPNIARLYDVGTTDVGSPFIVMEHVDGLPLTQHCAEHQLSIADRLTLFRKITDAVAYAHRNLVVHRDLKPSNILVRGDGEPVLLDFGIAKLLDAERPAAGVGRDLTAPWHRALTPSYASPEQIRGAPTTTGSDVYSLGVLLYEMLTGSLPFDLAGCTAREAEGIVHDTEPRPPSHAATASAAAMRSVGIRAVPAKHARALTGDLDAVTMKALRASPEDRYGSVEQLANDLDRHRLGLPVSARRGSWRYRAGRFVRRNRGRVATAATFVLLLIGFAGAMAWQAARTANERDQARLERDKKEQVVTLVQDVFAFSNPFVRPGDELSVRAALERSVPLLRRRLTDQPEVLGEMLDTVGTIYGSLRRFEDAARELDLAYVLRRQTLGEDHPAVISLQSRRATILAMLNHDGAQAMAEAAVVAAREVPAHPELLLETLNNLALITCLAGCDETSAAFTEEALRLSEGLPAAEEQRIRALEFRGPIETSEGRYEEAETLYLSALEARRARYGSGHPAERSTVNNLGVVQRRQGRLDAAERSLRRVVEIEERSFGAAYVDPIIFMNLGGVEIARAEPAKAIEHFRHALELVGGSGADHRLTLHIEMKIAGLRIDLGEAAAAEVELRRLVDALREERGPDHWLVAQTQNLLGKSLSVQGRFDEAEPILVASYERLLEVARVRHRVDALERLIAHSERAGRPEAIPRYRQMLEAVTNDG